MKKSLLQIAQDQSALEELIQETGGELNENLEQFLQEVGTDLAKKSDNYACMMDVLNDTAERYRKRAQAYISAARSCENIVERMKERIHFAMTTMGVEELSGNSIRFKLQNSPPSLFLGDLSKIPREFQVVTVTPDTSKIRSALRDGIQVGEAKLEQSKHIRTYLKK
jgi:uncharacterized membrane-anchored protein YjiN (DUF445 family)